MNSWHLDDVARLVRLMREDGYDIDDIVYAVEKPWKFGPDWDRLTTGGAEPRRVRVCPTHTPEVHELGEFPMTCYRCHVEADA